MRCKVGDVAVIVWARNPVNIGKFVTVLEFVGEVEGWRGDDRWLIDGEVVSNNGDIGNTVRDCKLRPLRPGEGTDETLTWKEVPKEYAHG